MQITFRKCLLLFLCLSCSHKSFQKTSAQQQIKIKNQVKRSDDVAAKIAVTNSEASDFVDETKELGLGEVSAYALYPVDIDDDGYEDLVYIPAPHQLPRVRLFLPKEGRFSEKSVMLLESDSYLATHLYFNDFNNDGVLDVLVASLFRKGVALSKKPVLFLGKKADKRIQFIRSSLVQNLPLIQSHGLVLADVNMDGYLDFFIPHWFLQKGQGRYYPGPDYLYLYKDGQWQNQSFRLKGEWEQKADDKNYYHQAIASFSGGACDVNGDGLVDFFSLGSHGYVNRLWLQKRNDTQLEFVEQGGEAHFAQDQLGLKTAKGGGKTLFADCHDYNGDGVMDLFMGEHVSSLDPPEVDKSSILTGSSRDFIPRFIRTEYDRGQSKSQWRQRDIRATWFDYNNDGLIDLLVENRGGSVDTRLILFRQQSDHSFVEVSVQKGVDLAAPHNHVIWDYDRDGKADIFVSQRITGLEGYPLRVLVNKTSHQSQVIHLHLDGQSSNTYGVGANLYWTTKKQGIELVQHNFMQFNRGHAPSQDPLYARFVIPKGHEFKQLHIRWPIRDKNDSNKAHQVTLENLKIDKTAKVQKITLCEDGGYFLEARSSCRSK